VAGKNQPWQLYDLKADRTEINNIIDKHPNIANDLINAYKKWAKKQVQNNPPFACPP